MQAAESTWWVRNRNWAIATLVAILVLLCLGGFVYFVFGMMKSSDAYQQGVAQARRSEQLGELIGTPISEGLLFTGNISVNSNGSGRADLAIPLSGPRGEGTLYVAARKSAGAWEFTRLVFQQDGGKRIDLLTTPKQQPAQDDE